MTLCFTANMNEVYFIYNIAEKRWSQNVFNEGNLFPATQTPQKVRINLKMQFGDICRFYNKLKFA